MQIHPSFNRAALAVLGLEKSKPLMEGFFPNYAWNQLVTATKKKETKKGQE